MKQSNFLARFKSVWNPASFQGWGRKKNYFEGWYYKLVSADQSHAFAIIPGIALSQEDSHAFVQIMDGVRQRSYNHRFPLEAFIPQPDRFEISVGANEFSDQLISICTDEVHGSLSFTDQVYYPGSFFSPGIMGWYSFVPFMQCNHGLVSINHKIDGKLKIYGKEVDFTGGKGYIEKDWGSSFPRAWVWTQCNNYDLKQDLSVMASVAHIPWLGTYFIGFLAIVFYKNKVKIFTTYTSAKMQLAVKNSIIKMSFWDKESRLVLEATRDNGSNLLAPVQGSMTGRVNESLLARHKVSFEYQKESIMAWGSNAGLEVGGNSLILLDQK